MNVEKETKIIEPMSSYKQTKRFLYILLERPENIFHMFYHLTLFILIFGSLVIGILSTMDELNEDKKLLRIMVYYEVVLLVWFSIEFLLRLWCCSYVGRYKGFLGRLQFMKSIYMVVDVFVISSTMVTAILHVNYAYFQVLRTTRFMQILRILRIDRQRGDLKFMIKVVRQHSKELLTCYFVGFVLLFTGAYVVYWCEKSGPEDDKINNMVNGLYWAMITVTSVGYGDYSPKTWAGKMTGGLFALVGCAFFALPAGILGSGFALQVDKEKKEKRYVKIRNPAACLIQSVWRNAALRTRHNTVGATWLYLLPVLRHHHLPYNEVSEIKKLMIKEFNKKRGELPLKTYNTLIPKDELLTDIPDYKNTGATRKSFKSSRYSYIKDLQGRHVKPKYKVALRFIMILKYWGLVRKFKDARYPFVNVQDVLEKTEKGHVEIIAQIKDVKETLKEFQTQLNDMKRMIASANPVNPVDEQFACPQIIITDADKREKTDSENLNTSSSSLCEA